MLSAAYDDGGFSGGNLERPGLQHLLAEVRAGRIDVIVTYKVDRLTRLRLTVGQGGVLKGRSDQRVIAAPDPAQPATQGQNAARRAEGGCRVASRLSQTAADKPSRSRHVVSRLASTNVDDITRQPAGTGCQLTLHWAT